MRTPLLTLLLVGCTAQQVDTSSSNDAIENGSKARSGLEPGTYDLPQSNKTIYIAAEQDTLVLDVDARAPRCRAIVVGVSSREATAQTSEPGCEMNLKLVRTPDGIDVRGTVTSGAAQPARYDGSYLLRQENVLDGRYRAGGATLIIDESTDTKMAVTIFSDASNMGLSGKAYAISLDDVMKQAVAAALGWAPARSFSVNLPGRDCDGSLYVQRDDRGEFSILTHGFEGGECPSGVMTSATRFRRER